MNKNIRRKKKAFTLVEVIIVLAIIAIIAAIAIPNLTKVRQQSKIKADEQSIQQLVNTVNMLVTDETLSVPASGSTTVITFNYSNKKVSAVIVDGATISADYKNYFIGIKQPQQEKKTGFQVTINSDGSIEGTTTP